ncbi:MAG: hypothetical protein RJQ10_10275 [Haliea sp.]|uniref:hypothetical protein n=1 Tax=Haliea sp. TaxID=1932666 RepID=UPI0032EC77E9
MSDVRSCRVGDVARLDVYWLHGEAGRGPCASLIIAGDEVMRLDCLGRNRGHMHINLKQTRGFHNGGSARLYFREQSIAGQIERACFELEYNLPYALAVNGAGRIRRCRFSPGAVENAVAFLRAEMCALHACHPDAVGGGSACAQPVLDAASPAGDITQESGKG